MRTFHFRVDGKHFNNRAFRKRWCHDHMISLSEFSSNANPKKTSDCWVFKFLRRSVDGKHLMRSQSQSETSIFKFLRHSFDGTCDSIYAIGKCQFFKGGGVSRLKTILMCFSNHANFQL